MWTAEGVSYLEVFHVDYTGRYLRSLSHRARALISGRSAPIVGRVRMNILVVDVTDIPGVSIGDEFLVR